MDGKTVIIIQARMGSSRLPGKVLLPIGSRTIVEQVYFQASASRNKDALLIATTVDPSDDVLFEYLQERNIPSFRGSLSDVLDRYYQAAKSVSAKTIIRITADCPLVDPEIIDQVIALYRSSGCDYCTNTNPPTFPDGLDVEVFSFEALEKSWNEAKLASEREHVTPYIRNHPEIFSHQNISNSSNLEHLRWTIDNDEDYRFLSAVFSRFRDNKIDFTNRPVSMNEVIAVINSQPDITAFNHHIERNEGMKKSLAEDKEIQ